MGLRSEFWKRDLRHQHLTCIRMLFTISRGTLNGITEANGGPRFHGTLEVELGLVSGSHRDGGVHHVP